MVVFFQILNCKGPLLKPHLHNTWSYLPYLSFRKHQNRCGGHPWRHKEISGRNLFYFNISVCQGHFLYAIIGTLTLSTDQIIWLNISFDGFAAFMYVCMMYTCMSAPIYMYKTRSIGVILNPFHSVSMQIKTNFIYKSCVLKTNIKFLVSYLYFKI